MSFPDSFLTDRLQAERLQPEHSTEIHRMHQDRAGMAMLGGVRDEAQTAEYMERNLRHWAEYGFGTWLLRDRGDLRVVGRAVLRNLRVEDADEIEVGYGFHPAEWGRGLAREVTGACLGYARHALQAASVVALTHPDHVRSQRVLTRVGMVYDREVEEEGRRLALFRTAPGWVNHGRP